MLLQGVPGASETLQHSPSKGCTQPLACLLGLRLSSTGWTVPHMASCPLVDPGRQVCARELQALLLPLWHTRVQASCISHTCMSQPDTCRLVRGWSPKKLCLLWPWKSLI